MNTNHMTENATSYTISTENMRYMAYVEPTKVRRLLKAITKLDFEINNYEIYCKEGPTGLCAYERYTVITPEELRLEIDRNMGYLCRTLRSLHSDSIQHGYPIYPNVLKSLSNPELTKLAIAWADSIITAQQKEEFLRELAEARGKRKG